MKIVSLTAAAAAALVALSGCVVYPAHSSYSRGYYGSDAEWQRHHYRDQSGRYYEYDDRESRDRRARGQ
jgi:hypothetical protein